MKRFLLLLSIVSSTVFATNDYFEVDGVVAKTSDVNSLIAKQKVLSISAQRAFNKLIDIYFPQAESLKDKVKEGKIQKCIYDYSIDQEKFSGKVYIAKTSYRFSRDKVVKLFRSHNILIGETKKSKKIKIAFYTDDYLSNVSAFDDCNILVFSPKKIVAEVSEENLDTLRNARITFEKVDDRISS